MMKPVEVSLREILRDNVKAENLESEFKLNVIERLKEHLYSIPDTLATVSARIRNLKRFCELLILVSGTVLGVWTPYLKQDHLYLFVAIWIAWPLAAYGSFWIIQQVPDDLDTIKLDVTRVKLINVCERLAAKLALFNLLPEVEGAADKEIIRKVSSLVPEITSLSPEAIEIVRNCMNPWAKIADHRDTNIEFPKLNVSDEIKVKLHAITQHIVILAEHMFDGTDFSAKLYLCVEKTFNEQPVQILTSFSRYPLKGLDGYGTSWVKASNPAIVWQCQAKGTYEIADTSSRDDTNYNSVLAICLPGSVGVLAITAQETHAFKDKMDKATAKALALVSWHLLSECLKGG